jgi:hypothetical protein
VTNIISGKPKLVKSAPPALLAAAGASCVTCDINVFSSALLFAGQHRPIARRVCDRVYAPWRHYCQSMLDKPFGDAG